MYIIMKLLIIIYIFASFVLFSPNLFFKSSKKHFLYYALAFSIFLYISCYFLESKVKEGAMLNSYDIHGNKHEIDVTNINLGEVKLSDEYSSLDTRPRIVYTVPEKKLQNGLTTIPPIVRQNQLNMDIGNLMKHTHPESYQRNERNVYCAAHHGETTTCCDQPVVDVPEENVCPKLKPYCSGYVANEKWGTCLPMNDEVPKLTYKVPKKNESCFNKDPDCSDTKTCGFCDDVSSWDGNISGKYVNEKQVNKGNKQPQFYVTIESYEKLFLWKNDVGSIWILERISNTHDYRVTGDPYASWDIAKVVLDDNNNVHYIIGPNNEIFVKQK